jgi:non-lysosomal glucosylceramidase
MPRPAVCPVASLRYILRNTTDQPLTATVCASLPNFIGTLANGNPSPDKPKLNNRNAFRTDGRLSGIFMDSQGCDPKDPTFGTIALTTLDAEDVTHRLTWQEPAAWNGGLLDFWDDFAGDGRLDPRPHEPSHRPVAALASQRTIAPGEEAAFTFLITWHFPNRQTWTPAKCDSDCGCKDGDPNNIGNYYCTRFADAWEAARHFAEAGEAYERNTVRFVGDLCRSDYPAEMKEAALFNLSTLRTQTCFRTPDGRFYGFEGACDGRGCCHGSCTHVWNYEQATAFLFGDLARTMREVEFAHCTDERGCMIFRVNLPLERAKEFGKAAADGQMGCIMKLYRDWQLSGDDQMLRDLWPHARRAVEFCWIDHGWDADQDGVMEGCQHNTMDVEYFGPNPQMTGWYLGALRAAAAMARHLGEAEFAGKCDKLFESGSKWMDEHLWNGRYYEHHIAPPDTADGIPACLYAGMGGKDLLDPDFQLGKGCLIDQLVGQYMSHVCGLGYLHDEEKVGKTLNSIIELNRRTGFHDHFNAFRSYALGDETALMMAAYPEGTRPAKPFPYFTEVMTGFEYTAAVGLIYEGEEEEGLQVIRDIRSRYDGRKRNPFDEAECGRHYARAMASWGALLAWSGFRYSAVEKTLRLASRAGRYFWSTGSAWGSYELAAQPGGGWQLTLHVSHGELAVEAALVGGESVAVG